MKRSLSIIAAAMALLGAAAQSSYEATAAKGRRFFDNGEWASAAATYNFLLRERPADTGNIGRAIVASTQMGDSAAAIPLLEKAMANAVPLDSVLAQVKALSFEVGNDSLYEHFMLRAARQLPWLARPLDAHLLKYYTFRRNGPQMIAYANRMLRGIPQHIPFLAVLAEGYLLTGQNSHAVQTWLDILAIDPNDYDALLQLAGYYEVTGHPEQALSFYRRAYAIRPTPYVAARIKQ